MKVFSFTLLFLTAFAPTALSAPYPSQSSAPPLYEGGIRTKADRAPDNPIKDSKETFSRATSGFEGSLVKRGNLFCNDLEEGKCAKNIIIFARGTWELPNMGHLVGVPLQDAIKAKFPPNSVIFQGVNKYPAFATGYFLGGSELGTMNMAEQVVRASRQCPGSRVFLVGYSQGAQITHKTAKRLPTHLHSIIGGIVVFGDPYRGRAFPKALNNNVLTICNPNDQICDGIAYPFGTHLDYERTTPIAASWMLERALI